LETPVPLIVLAISRWHRFDIRHKRTIPGALPAETERAVEIHQGLPGQRVFEIIPRADK
jgi:hypothetical protein